ncbi:DUF4097 domain-containing protein [Nocardioides sp. DS6]|uniref:DUF4097 domain-containing protein n=1 Tax=Nocardioides eburneus TaxID=3231482 RepID=A0ABV3SZ35_9ACTN
MTVYTFGTPGAIRLYVELGKGRLDVTANDTDTTTVTVEGDDPDEVRVTREGDLVSVVAPRDRGLFGLGGKGHSVAVTLPEGSAMRAQTGSADVAAVGALGTAQVKTGSGELDLDRVTGAAELATGSGDIAVGRVGGRLGVKTGSGDIRIVEADGTVRVSTGSGDVQLDHTTDAVEVKTGSGDLRIGTASGEIAMATGSGDLEIRALTRGRLVGKGASGDIRIGVPAGTPVWTDLSTVSGQIRSGLKGAGQPAEGQDHVELRARTVSGDITLIEA